MAMAKMSSERAAVTHVRTFDDITPRNDIWSGQDLGYSGSQILCTYVFPDLYYYAQRLF
jgi:hypothetical protein